MPDLSKRPERYATAIVALIVAGSFAYGALGVRFGADPKLAQTEAMNRALQSRLHASAETTDGPTSTADATTTTSAANNVNCSSFGTQQAAQAYWISHKAEYPDWDGNHNGLACEQLKSTSTTALSAAPTSTPTNTATSTSTGTSTSTSTSTGTSTSSSPDPTKTVVQIIRVNAIASKTEPAAPVQTPLPSVAAKPTAPSKATILESRQHFGLYTATDDEYTGLEASLARDTTMHGYFEGFDTDFQPSIVNSIWAQGEIPFMTWESRPLSDATSTVDYSLTSIASGAFDPYLKKYADDIKANGLPLIIRFDQEMNGNWYRWSESNPAYGNPAGSYVAAWRHVHDIFQAEGANSLVIWDWSPNRIDNILRLPSIDNYYPGDAYTDWVGMTGYYRPGDAAPTFTSTFTATLNELRRVAPGKPILLSEVGATETGNNKVAWVNSFFAGLVANPDIIGFDWFNYAVTVAGFTNDWRIQSSTAVLNAFRTGLYATDFGRDKGKKPILVTTVPTPPTPTPSPTPTPTPTAS